MLSSAKESEFIRTLKAHQVRLIKQPYPCSALHLQFVSSFSCCCSVMEALYVRNTLAVRPSINSWRCLFKMEVCKVIVLFCILCLQIYFYLFARNRARWNKNLHWGGRRGHPLALCPPWITGDSWKPVTNSILDLTQKAQPSQESTNQ